MHYKGANSYLFVNGTEIIKFKAKDSEINAYLLYLGNISKDWSVDNMKRARLKGYVYDFSVDYNAIEVTDILDIQKYLIEKRWDSIKMFRFLKQILFLAMMFLVVMYQM